MKEQNDYAEIDLLALMRAVLKRAWIVILATLLLGVMAYGYAAMFVKPVYTSQAQMLVLSSSTVSGDGRTPTSAELYAAQQLATAYMIILRSTPTMERVIEKVGLTISPEALKGMVKTQSVQDTEIFQVTVTASSPQLAKDIADAIVEVFPERIREAYPGSVLNAVERPSLPKGPSAPNKRYYALVGAFLGFAMSCLVVILLDINDDVISSTDYLTKNYDIPILSVIPDLADSSDSGYGYHYGYYYYSSREQSEGEKK